MAQHRQGSSQLALATLSTASADLKAAQAALLHALAAKLYTTALEAPDALRLQTTVAVLVAEIEDALGEVRSLGNAMPRFNDPAVRHVIDTLRPRPRLPAQSPVPFTLSTLFSRNYCSRALHGDIRGRRSSPATCRRSSGAARCAPSSNSAPCGRPWPRRSSSFSTPCGAARRARRWRRARSRGWRSASSAGRRRHPRACLCPPALSSRKGCAGTASRKSLFSRGARQPSPNLRRPVLAAEGERSRGQPARHDDTEKTMRATDTCVLLSLQP